MLLLLGCNSWIDRKPACELDVYEWSDDLVGYVLQGPGDGSFDFNPEDVPRRQVKGDYKYGNGDFAWDVVYVADFWLETAEVEGYGTAYHNGNLDVAFTETRTDMLGETTRIGHRQYRTGCSARLQTWDADAEDSPIFDAVGRFEDADTFHWTAEDEGYTYEGGYRRNQSWTFNQDARDESYHDSFAMAASGVGTGLWTGECYDNGCECETDYTITFDGGLDELIEVTCNGEPEVSIVASYEYDLTGTATYEYADGTTCDVTYDENDACHYECSDGREGRC